MKEKVISEFSVSAGEGKALVVSKGQIVSFIEIEGKQMGDIVFLNAHDYKESFHAGWSAALNMMLGEGDRRDQQAIFKATARQCDVDRGRRCDGRSFGVEWWALQPEGVRAVH